MRHGMHVRENDVKVPAKEGSDEYSQVHGVRMSSGAALVNLRRRDFRGLLP